jgi:hypothetical protein
VKDPKSYDLLSFVVLFVGVYEGLLPFLAKLLDWDPTLAFPRLLDGPWWWIVSGLVVASALRLLEAIDRAKKRRFA